MAASAPGAPAVGPSAAPAEQSALLLFAPAAEPAVGEHRARLDPAARVGIPAHLTVLFPFLPPELIDGTVLAALRRLFAGVPSFAFTLDRVDWFGDDIVWLGPSDDRPFRSLTALVFASYPSCPPFGGRHADVIPHLTIGHKADLADLRAAAAAVRPHLPVTGTATEIALTAGPGPETAAGVHRPATWRTLATFPLGPPGRH